MYRIWLQFNNFGGGRKPMQKQEEHVKLCTSNLSSPLSRTSEAGTLHTVPFVLPTKPTRLDSKIRDYKEWNRHRRSEHGDKIIEPIRLWDQPR